MEKYNLKPSLSIDKNKLKNSILNTIPYSVFVLNKRKDIIFINNYNSTLKHLYNIEIEEGSNFSLLLNVEDTFLKEQFIKLNSCLDNVLEKQIRSEERRVGKECVSTFCSRCAVYH